MSTAFVRFGDLIDTKGTDLTTNTVTDVYTAPTDKDVVVTHIHVAETTGSADTITLQWEDGSGGTLYDICTAHAIAANTVLDFAYPYFLKRGSDIKATAATANRLHVIVSAFPALQGL